MEEAGFPEVDEALAYIQQNLYEPLSLSRLAGYVAYSPYHFNRIFKERVGLSPLYYVSSLRLQKAKELLLRTDWSVRDIGLEIGQQSLGTFTTRFTEKVGVSPTVFRNSAYTANLNLRSLQAFPEWPALPPVTRHHATIEGTVQSEIPFAGAVLIGLFAKPIPEGLPVYGTMVASPGHFRFASVKPGTYYIMAASVSWEMQAMDVLLPNETLRARPKTPIIVERSSVASRRDLVLRAPSLDDPPILVSLPLLMKNFIQRHFKTGNR